MKPALLLAVALVAAAADLALIQPAELAASIPAKTPVILYVGPNVLFRSKHIPGSIYAGQGFTAEGTEGIKKSTQMLPRDREIIIYCGCCPWDHCPNIKPATATLKAMGFTKVRALYLPIGFKADWIDKNLPVEPK